jgi:hypothetical protein
MASLLRSACVDMQPATRHNVRSLAPAARSRGQVNVFRDPGCAELAVPVPTGSAGLAQSHPLHQWRQFAPVAPLHRLDRFALRSQFAPAAPVSTQSLRLARRAGCIQ